MRSPFRVGKPSSCVSHEFLKETRSSVFDEWKNEQSSNNLGGTLHAWFCEEREKNLSGKRKKVPTLSLSQNQEEAVALQWSILLSPVPHSGHGATSSHE